jgi:hypothetical protein
LFVFVHAGQNADHEIIENSVFRELEDSKEMEGKPESATEAGCESVADSRPDGWQLKDTPRQVKLVDLLQFMLEIGSDKVPLPVAVMISAWDLVEALPKGAENETPKVPSRFLAVQWPLLDQFLRSHPQRFRSRVFGVSGRGGSRKEDIVKADRARDRVILVDGSHRSTDISRPVQWLLGLLNSVEPSNA